MTDFATYRPKASAPQAEGPSSDGGSAGSIGSEAMRRLEELWKQEDFWLGQLWAQAKLNGLPEAEGLSETRDYIRRTHASVEKQLSARTLPGAKR